MMCHNQGSLPDKAVSEQEEKQGLYGQREYDKANYFVRSMGVI
jgi:hypothetical protein